MPNNGHGNDSCFRCGSRFIYYNCTQLGKKLCAIHAHGDSLARLSCCTYSLAPLNSGVVPNKPIAPLTEPASSFCTMCEGNYTEMSTTHRYQTCPYFNGCSKCGMDQALARHVKVCSGFPSFISHDCVMCGCKFRGSSLDHRSSCAYYKGCPICGGKFFAADHISDCRKKAVSESMSSEETLMYLCESCDKFIHGDIFSDHTRMCRKLGAIIDGVVSVRETREASDKSEARKSECFWCGENIVSEYLESHMDRCRKKVAERFERTGQLKPAGEPDLVDNRPKPGEKVVKFKEDEP